MSLRFLHVVESLRRGGIETTFLNVLRAFSDLQDEGPVEHHVLSFSGGPLEAGYREAAASLVIASSTAEITLSLNRGYDLVNLNFDRCAHRLAPLLLARFHGAVFYSKGYDMSAMYRLQGGFERSAEDALLSACDGVSFTTPDLARLYDLPEGRLTALCKAVDFDSFARVPAVSEATPNRVLCIANLHARKRPGDLVSALRLLLNMVPDAEMRVVGEGSPFEVEKLQQEVRSDGLSDRFVIAGRSDDVGSEIKECRVVALPSESEGVPTVLLEAMAARRPVVCTRVGHVETIVTNGCEGYIVQPGDVSAIAQYLAAILLDRALAARMGEAARARASTHDVKPVARKHLAAMRRAAAGDAGERGSRTVESG